MSECYIQYDFLTTSTQLWILLQHRSVHVTSCCTPRSSSYSSSCLRPSTLSWTSWSRSVCVCVLPPQTEEIIVGVWPLSWLCGAFASLAAGTEKDFAWSDGASAESRLRAAGCWLHSQVSGETQHWHLPHQIFCYRGNRLILICGVEITYENGNNLNSKPYSAVWISALTTWCSQSRRSVFQQSCQSWC